MAKSNKRERDGVGLSSKSHGLGLDDYLNAVAHVRSQFGLTAPTFGLTQIETAPAATITIDAVVEAIIARHGFNICSKPHPLLTGLGKDIYAEPIETSVYSGHQIRQDCISQTLRRVIEVGLQTIVQLPSKEAKPVSVPKQLKSLALTLSRSAQKLDAVLNNAEVRRRIELWGETANSARILRIAGEILWGVDALNAAAGLKVTRVRMNSPNPQIGLTMYFIGWVGAAAGRPHYENVTTLVQAAFSAAGQSTPKWPDRLPIEMHQQRNWRKKWIGFISS
jgi:hypothetical protein